MNIIDIVNPYRYISQTEYMSIWMYLFETFLQGFWARVGAVVFLILAFWFGVRRQSFYLGFIFFILTVFMTYAGGLLIKLIF
jgi:hypothetical protein